MNIQLVMEMLDLIMALANSVLKKNGPAMDYVAVTGTLMLIAQKADQVYRQYTGQPLDQSLIKGENPV